VQCPFCAVLSSSSGVVWWYVVEARMVVLLTSYEHCILSFNSRMPIIFGSFQVGERWCE